MSCCPNVSVSKSGLYKFLGVKISGAKIVGYPLYGIGLEVGNCPFLLQSLSKTKLWQKHFFFIINNLAINIAE